jgi:hypothetical protein
MWISNLGGDRSPIGVLLAAYFLSFFFSETAVRTWNDTWVQFILTPNFLQAYELLSDPNGQGGDARISSSLVMTGLLKR